MLKLGGRGVLGVTLVISSVGFPLWLCPASVSPSNQCLPALAALFSSACNESSILCFEDSYYHCLLNVGTYVEVRKQQFLIILLHLPQDALLRNVSSFQDGPIQMSCFILLRQCSFLQRDGAPRNPSPHFGNGSIKWLEKLFQCSR